MAQYHHLQHHRRANWAQLGERTRLMLQRLNDCILLRESDFIPLVWPKPVSRQAHADRLKSWQAAHYLQVISSADGLHYQLDRSGARSLRDAGFKRVAPVRLVAERVRRGLLLANQFGVALHDDIGYEPAVSGLSWTVTPFGGRGARGDGLAALSYTLNGQPANRERPDAYAPFLGEATYVPSSGLAVQRLVVEIDCGTETGQQLAQRARHWRSRWEQTTWPPATHALFLWITTGGPTRLEAIWRAWTHHALLPAFFTTVDTLTLGTGGHWHPWNPRRLLPDGRTVWVWRDMYGRPRSLRPWDGDEPTLRFEQPQPVSAASLAESVERWEQG